MLQISRPCEMLCLQSYVRLDVFRFPLVRDSQSDEVCSVSLLQMREDDIIYRDCHDVLGVFCKTFVKQCPTKLGKKFGFFQMGEMGKSANHACRCVECGYLKIKTNCHRNNSSHSLHIGICQSVTSFYAVRYVGFRKTSVKL